MAKKGIPIKELIPTRLIQPSERPPITKAKIHNKRLRFFYVIFQLCSLFLGNFWLRLKGKKGIRRREERILEYVQRLGMLWIRVAQVLSVRGSTLSNNLGLSLMDMRDHGGAYGFEEIRRVIETELKQPLENIFSEFEEKSFFASSVSQLHRAKLRKEKIWTAVKIQHPQAEAIFNRDLTFIRRFIILMKLFSIKTNMRWDELFHELKQIKVRELNYYYEAAALENLDKNLQGQPIYVPKTYRQYCRQRVLVMEFIQGALLSDVVDIQKGDPARLQVWLNENNINLKKVARRLFHSSYRQVFEKNFFHGDMNTHNIILLRDSYIAVIECRSAGSLEVESLEKQKMFIRALSEREYVIAAEIYFLLASRLPRVDLITVKEKLIRLWRVWETRTHVKKIPYEQKSLAFMTGQVNQVVHDSQFAPLWSFTRLTCAWVHLDNALAILDPQWNYLKQLRRYFKGAEQRENFLKIRRLPSRLASALGALHEVPKRTAEYTLFRETLMRRQAQVVQGSASKFDAVIANGFNLLSFLVLVLGGFFVLAFLKCQLLLPLDPILGKQLSSLASSLPQMNPGVWILIFVAIGFLYGFLRFQSQRFSRQEFGDNNKMSGVETE